MSLRTVVPPVMLASVALACASVPPPATRSPQNPAHPEAAEAPAPPLKPTLMSDAGSPPPPRPQPGHGNHAPIAPDAGAGGQDAGPYVCPMHPAVKSEEPGACPVCGRTLAPKAPEAPKP